MLLEGNLLDFGNVLNFWYEEKRNKIDKVNTHLTNESIQEGLSDFVAVGVPLKAMCFTERVELFSSYSAIVSGLV